MDNNSLKKIKKRIYQIVEVGYTDDFISRAYDFVNVVAVIVNIAVAVMMTYDDLRAKYLVIFTFIESASVFFFLVDYILRVFTASELYHDEPPLNAVFKYVLSFMGIVDLLSFLPYYIPVFFPSGTIAFRMFRVIRILRLFRLNAYYDSLSVITNVIKRKSVQIVSSLFIVILMMLSSSLCMYSLEHEAQPEVFSNALSGMWWAVSTLLTVGYGDIYPITDGGRIFGMIIAILGVCVVAIPTGIISAGFVEEFQRMKYLDEETEDTDIRFIRTAIDKNDYWVGKRINELKLPKDMLVTALLRGEKIMIPDESFVIMPDDLMIFASKHYRDEWQIELKEIILRYGHPWIGLKIRELNISRQDFIVVLRRNDEMIDIDGDIILEENDVMVIYTRYYLREATKIKI
ncbi:MAG: ion transporter [Lachnospiraceae bacterium]|nr:ion transporter [Lachnospiraceae bacterium]